LVFLESLFLPVGLESNKDFFALQESDFLRPGSNAAEREETYQPTPKLNKLKG
jgi:hypothetical protein